MEVRDMNTGYLIQLSAKLMKNNLQKRLDEENFTVSQLAVIKDLQMQQESGAPLERFTAVSIAERLDMDKPTVSGIINRLVEKGFVEKLSHPTDKRAQVIALTNESVVILPKLEQVSNETIEASLKGFSDIEKDKLNSYLIRLISNLRGD
ncbi:MarR family transcriptional regulator [Anaerobacillus alkaliphilus]|uniref:MarR family transcriptional regulator n=2 Tax=Anaerobacillus alkaliphilus TaxID=1548597 RepID=A0A4Q0VS76_9BACI|nr:MarR family transcriptional regulator [Anaerobacillus alkaliphilus]